MSDVAGIVEIVRQGEPRDVGHFSRDNFFGRPFVSEQLAAERSKAEIGFAGDDVVRQIGDLLLIDFVANLRSADRDDDFGPETFQRGDHFCGFGDVPDVNAKADDLRVLRQQGFDHIERALVDVELDHAGARTQITHIGQQVTQAKRRVNVFRVQGGQDDVHEPFIIIDHSR